VRDIRRTREIGSDILVRGRPRQHRTMRRRRSVPIGVDQRQILLADPDGNLIELFQPADRPDSPNPATPDRTPDRADHQRSRQPSG
jgi:hypothetical protein